MSAAPAVAIHWLSELRDLVREANQLGATFRFRGADIAIGDFERLPAPLAERLTGYADSGWLFAYLGGDLLDRPAIELGRRLGIENVVVTTIAALRRAIRQLEADKRQYGRYIGLDIETGGKAGCGAPRPPIVITIEGAVAERQPGSKDRTALSPHLADIGCLQLYGGGKQCFIVRGAALAMLLRSHWLRRQHFIVHNAVFETGFIQTAANGYRLPPGRRAMGRVDCSMQGAGLLLGAERSAMGGRSLANTAEKLLGITVPKDLQTSDWSAPRLSPGQIAYAASDAILARRLWPIIERDLERKGRAEAYELQRRAIPAVADMQLRGVAIDREEHRRQVDTWASELAAARRRYLDITGNPPPSKPAEIRAWLARVLSPEQLAQWPRTITGELSIAGIYLKRLASIDSAKPVLEIIAREKLLQNFGARLAAFINPATGRIHCDYNLAASKAGRFSASMPNLQQMPNSRAPDFKQCIVAAPGNVLVGCDWSQVELRAAAWIAKDRALTRVYADGRDLHAETAARISGVPVEAVTPARRQAAKPVNFGAIYGIGPKSLRDDAFANYGIEMSEREAKHALDRFATAYPQLWRWRHEHADLCQRRGYVVIGCGRVVEAAWERSGQLSFPQCCNLPIQGQCADAMLRAITLVHARLKRARINGGLIACVHDELLLEVAEADAAAAGAILEEAMLEAFCVTFPGAPTAGIAKVASGRSWGDVK